MELEQKIGELTELNAILHSEKAKIQKDSIHESNQNNTKISQLTAKLQQTELELGQLKINSESSNDKILLQNEIAKSQQLKMQVEMLENSRQSFQNTAMELLKQSQKESSKMAFSQSQRSFEILKVEWQKEQKLQLELKLGPYLQKIEHLEGELAVMRTKDYEISVLKDQLKTSKTKFNELETLHLGCESRITILRKNASPSVKELDILSSRVIDLQEKLKRPQYHQKEPSSELEAYKIQMQNQLHSKNREIAKFKSEIDGLIENISLLKQGLVENISLLKRKM